MTAEPRVADRSPNLMFAVVLVLSWVLVTGAVGIVIWTERGAPAIRLATWVSLWAFTVPVPTLYSLTIRRVVRALTRDGAPEDQIVELRRLQPLLLLSANMAILTVFALIFGR